jgi:signal transduction histidine kinase/CheY-like chemotaxis protein
MTIWSSAGLQRPRFGQRLGVRLAAALGLAAVTSALLAMAAMLAIAWHFAQRDAIEESHQVAHSVAFALQAPVSFADQQGIEDALAVLKARPQIHGAWVHDQAGRLLKSTGRATLHEGETDLGSLAQGWLQVSVPILAGSAADRVGRVTVHMDLEVARHKLRIQAMAAAAASLPAALLALVVSQLLARRMTVPVVRMAAIASKITRDQNYELRLPPAGPDEVGVAVNAFNHMLNEVQQRGTTLVTVNRQLQQQAELARAAQQHAEAASQAKTRFLANMSHELRSPLNGVIGAAQLLHTQGADAGRRAELVQIIRTSGGNLLGLIEQVLDLARIEAGALELQPQDFNLLDCIEAAVLSSAPVAAAKGLRLSCHVDPALALWRHGDDARLRQLVLNLLGNAVKFTPRGEVSVDVLPVEGQDTHLIIQVRDTGIGVAPEALGRVFEPFQQADASTTRRFGGSGLGLAICRDLALLMGGDVRAQSIVGVGSCFTLELPLPPARSPGETADRQDLRLVWYEPHEPSAKALAGLLKRLGCQAARCHDWMALEAVLKAERAKAGPPWFIVAVDCDSGRDLLTRALPLLDLRRVLPIDGTADSQQASERAALGLPRALPRPVLRSALVSRLASGRRAPMVEHDAPFWPATGRAWAQVLLVEDDPINQAVVRAMLQHAGVSCTVAGSGAAALQLLKRSAYDLVLMDWQMPEMDGLEATRRLRAGDAGGLNIAVPVVALTANAFAEDRGECLAAGMDDFVTKPVLASHLTSVVERWTLQRQAVPSDFRPLDQAT